MADKRIFIKSSLDLSESNWLRHQSKSLDLVLGSLSVRDYGILNGVPWIVVPEEELPKLGMIEYDASDLLFLHMDLSGGDSKELLGLANDGNDSIRIAATLRQTEDPESEIISYTGALRFVINNSEKAVYDIVSVPFTMGSAEVDYSSTGLADICSIDIDEDLIEIDGQEYKIAVIGDTGFKVYRELSAAEVSAE